MSIVSYFMLFLEGILAFISPCILPMLPVYITYLAGNYSSGTEKKRILVINTLGFILGFTIVFVTLGATATSLGSLLSQHRLLLQRIGGVIIILFGLNLMGVIRLNFLNHEKRVQIEHKEKNFFSSLIFGIVFSLGWTPCLGTFLGTALLMASNSGTLLIGMTMLFTFAMGLGVPFLITALIFDSLTGTFSWIKRHYEIINRVSGIILIVIGILMATNLFGYYLGLFN